jgi:hypothetical protein
MTNRAKLENVLNMLIKKKYPFVQDVEVVRIIQHFNDLRGDINFYVTKDFIKEHVRYDCYDQMEKDDDIFFSLFSFNWCSDEKIDESYIYNLVETTYKMLGLAWSHSINNTNLSLSVVQLPESNENPS